jgi:hypothetical protein
MSPFTNNLWKLLKKTSDVGAASDKLQQAQAHPLCAPLCGLASYLLFSLSQTQLERKHI